MSIPGLGNIPQAPVVTASTQTQIRKLLAFWEWRFEVRFGAKVTVKLLSGTAEKDGTELAIRHPYTFEGVKSKIMTWRGCDLEITGTCDDEFIEEYTKDTDTPMTSYLHLHSALSSRRAKSMQTGTKGPRVLVVGPPASGKSTLTRTLAAYATKLSCQPLVVNLDPKEGMLSVPGTLSACVLATMMDITANDGWGTSSTSSPGQIPAKLPLVAYYGHQTPETDPNLYRQLVSQMAGIVTDRFVQDPNVRYSGIIIDTAGVKAHSKTGLDLIAHIVEEYSVNVIVVLGSSRINSELSKRFEHQTTSLDEKISVVHLDKSNGVVEVDEAWLQQTSNAAIKEYFFGHAGHALSPSTLQVDFDTLAIYKPPEYSLHSLDEGPLVRVEPSPDLEHSTLAIVHASHKDSTDVIRMSNVLGFVYVNQVDMEKRKVKILAPARDRKADNALVWGDWPGQHFYLD